MGKERKCIKLQAFFEWDYAESNGVTPQCLKRDKMDAA